MGSEMCIRDSPHAVQILDWFHATEYLTPLAPLVSDDEDEAATWLTNIRSALWNSEFDTFFDSLAQLEQRMGIPSTRYLINTIVVLLHCRT